jgi:opacity protein-like surface antigen
MNQSTLMNRIVNRFLVAAFLSIPVPLLLAGTETDDPKDGKEVIPPPEIQPWCETPSPLEIQIGIPGWLSGISGDVGVKGIVGSVDIPFHQLFDHLTHIPLALSADVRYQRWEFFGNGEYVEVGDSVTLPGLLFTNANMHLKAGGAGGFVGYRLINCTKAWLSLFAGARYTYLEGDLSLVNNGDARLVILRRLLGLSNKLDFSGSTGWVDPVIGARGKVKIWKATSFYAEGDVGGFNANSGSAFEVHREGRRNIVKTPIDSSDWSYQIQGGLEFQISRWFGAQVGWRYLKYDYVSAGFTDKLALNGPFIQGGVNF